MPKPVFSSSDATITSHKIDKLAREMRAFVDRLDRINEEVELLRKANHAMAKTIKSNQYRS